MSIWECKLDTGWQPYDPSLAAKIESHYQSNARQYTFKRKHGRSMFSYCCDFDKMLQINTKNNKFREIRRLNQTIHDNSGVRWQCYADGGWLDFDLKLNGKLERAFRKGKICTFSRKISRHGKSFSYKCDWTRMKQINLQNGKERSIRRLGPALPFSSHARVGGSNDLPSSQVPFQLPQLSNISSTIALGNPVSLMGPAQPYIPSAPSPNNQVQPNNLGPSSDVHIYKRGVQSSPATPMSNLSQGKGSAVWQCASDRGWMPFSADLSLRMENAYQTRSPFGFQRRFGRADQVYHYECDWDRMKQVNLFNRTERSIRRVVVPHGAGNPTIVATAATAASGPLPTPSPSMKPAVAVPITAAATAAKPKPRKVITEFFVVVPSGKGSKATPGVITIQASFPKLHPHFRKMWFRVTPRQAKLLSVFTRATLRSGRSMKDLAGALGITWDTIRNRPQHCRQWRQLRGLVYGFLREMRGCWGGLLVKGPSARPPVLPSDKFRVNKLLQSGGAQTIDLTHEDKNVHTSVRHAEDYCQTPVTSRSIEASAVAHKTAMTPPPTTTGVLATAPVADAVVFRPSTDNVQFPLIDSSYNVVAVATGQTSEYIDIDVPAAVQMSPSAATAATATSIPIVGAVGPSTASLTNTHADSIGGHD